MNQTTLAIILLWVQRVNTKDSTIFVTSIVQDPLKLSLYQLINILFSYNSMLLVSYWSWPSKTVKSGFLILTSLIACWLSSSTMLTPVASVELNFHSTKDALFPLEKTVFYSFMLLISIWFAKNLHSSRLMEWQESTLCQRLKLKKFLLKEHLPSNKQTSLIFLSLTPQLMA